MFKADQWVFAPSKTALLRLFAVLLLCFNSISALAEYCDITPVSVVFSSNELSKDTSAQRDVSIRVACNSQTTDWSFKTTPTSFSVGKSKEDGFYAIFYQKTQAIVDDDSAIHGAGSQEIVLRLFLGSVRNKEVAIRGIGLFERIRSSGFFAFNIPLILTYGKSAQMSQNTANISGLVPTTCSIGTISRVFFDRVSIGMVPRQNVTIPLSCESELHSAQLPLC